MDRFPTPQPHDRTAGPAPFAPGDGLAQGMIYTAVVQGTPSGGTVPVTIPALHLSASLVAHVPPGTICVSGETCCVALDEQKIPWIVASKTLSAPTFVSALPASPLDGQEVYFQNELMAALGLVWHFRYRAGSTSTHKWEFIGGHSSYGFGGDITTASAAYVSLTTGPTFPFPLPGEYFIDASCVFISTATTGAICTAFLGAAETSTIVYESMSGAQELVARARPVWFGGNAGDVVSLKVRSTTATTVRFVNATLSVLPIRVG